MNRTSLTFLLVLSMAAGVGCSSKNYVKQQTTPLINKTNELDDLTKKAQEALDQLATDVPNAKGFIITVEGGTDSVGSAEYNYGLSERRADSVIQYLASKHNIPAHKIYLVGLGKDKPVEDNKSREGRAKNRRVDVRLMTNTAEGSTPAQQQAPATAPPPSE